MESARWLAISGQQERAVRGLKVAARINGRKKEGEKLSVEVVSGEGQMQLCSDVRSGEAEPH